MRQLHWFGTILGLALIVAGCAITDSPEETADDLTTQAVSFTSTLVAQHSGKCLDLTNNALYNTALLEQEACDRSEAPMFEFIEVPDQPDTYLIRNKRSRKCLDIYRARTGNSVPLIQYSCGNVAHRQFELLSVGGNYYQLRAKHSGKCVDVRYLSKRDGAEIVQYSCRYDEKRYRFGNQLWRIDKGDAPEKRDLESFTLVALPDTQNYVCCDGRRGTPATFRAQTQWIVDNLDTLAIDFVTHEGDIVSNASKGQEWRYADEAMSVLDGQVPYSVAAGDHDYYPEEVHDGDTSLYRKYFGKNRYKGYDWYGGAGPRHLSHFQVFEGGEVTFLHIALEWEAPSDALAWAKGVIKTYAETPTIITTHAYLRDGGSSRGGRRFTQGETEACVNLSSGRCGDPGNDPDAASGEKIFQTLVEPYPQVFMVLNGHYHNNGRRSSNPNVEGCDIAAEDFTDSYATRLRCDNGEYRQVSTNSVGSEVYEMLANYQDYENGGDGWLRIIKFLPDGGEGGLDRIEVQTYSPTLGEFQSGSASDFFYDLDFAERLGLE